MIQADHNLVGFKVTLLERPTIRHITQVVIISYTLTNSRFVKFIWN